VRAAENVPLECRDQQNEPLAEDPAWSGETMTLMVELSPDEEVRLAVAAQRAGLAPAELARRLVVEHLQSVPDSREDDPTLALFAQWEEEDAQMTPEEIKQARREFEEFKQGINAERARAGARLIYP
jgi:hypothetical protein